MRVIQSVPTNIITGFLGVGKTTAINHLLANKPANERWAILMNEFGEIGVDASLLGVNTHKNAEAGIFIKEVAGGCMCCTSGLPMQVALNRLLSEAKPHRLIIEPTGLGHPREVLETLSQAHYKHVLKLQATICLVDARNLSDERYTSNQTFNQQLAVADIVIGNKIDLYQQSDKQQLVDYCNSFDNQQLSFVEQAQVDWQLLSYPNNFKNTVVDKHPSILQFSTQLDAQTITDESLPSCGYIVKENKQDGFYSVGWQFNASFVFKRLDINIMLMGIQAERIKGVFITEDGVFGYNKTPYGLTEIMLDDAVDTRIEIIDNKDVHIHKEKWQQELLTAQIC